MRDIWGVVTAIAGVLAVAVGVIVFLLGRSEQRKTLQVELVSRSALVDERIKQEEGSLQLMYNGHPIANYAILQLRVANAGGQPIRAGDYEEPVRLRLGNVEEILSAREVSSDPKELKVAADVKGSDVALSAVLLNPGDWYVVDVRVVPRRSQVPGVQPIGRIAGVKRLDYKETIGESRGDRASQFLRLAAILQAFLAAFMVVSIAFWMRWYRRIIPPRQG